MEETINDDDLIESAVFGKRVEDFMSSDIGTYLLTCARIEAEEAMAELKSVSAFSPEKIIELQSKLKRAESIKQWMFDAVLAGKQALSVLEGKDDDGQ
jgi:hypothetical protein